jgi:hypothetical protein
MSEGTRVPVPWKRRTREVEYSHDPDVQTSMEYLWTKGDVGERAKNIKFMWGILYLCMQ